MNRTAAARYAAAAGVAVRAMVLVALLTAAAVLAPPPPARAASVCGTCIGVIGDSLTYQGGQGTQRLVDSFVAGGVAVSDLRVDGKTGRGIAGTTVAPSTVEVIRQWRADGFDPRVFVLALGTNNKNATSELWVNQISKVLAEIGPGHVVHWIGLGFFDAADPRVLAFQATLSGVASGRTDLFVHDWNTYVHAGAQDGLWDIQGIHMTAAGYAIRNKFYVASSGCCGTPQATRPERRFP